MNSQHPPVQCMEILGYSLCAPDVEELTEFGIPPAAVDASILPAMVRRRTSMATKMAISALDQACNQAALEKELPVIFTSSVGEMAVTDTLCRAISTVNYPLSPTLFHNSVHNTAAGYWSMAVKSMAPMQSMAGMSDSFAMGLLEAACQLQNGAEQLLLVSYDESMPAELLPEYRWKPCAVAMVLANISAGKTTLSRPFLAPARPSDASEFSAHNPTFAAAPLLRSISKRQPGTQLIPVSMGEPVWQVNLEQRSG